MNKQEKIEKLDFENTLKDLEEIIQQLEKGELNLEESIQKYEEGMKLVKNCNDFLENAEKRITKLIKNQDGKIIEEDFEN